MTDKEKILQLFFENVKGKKPDLTGFSARHDGKAGHWLEQRMGIAANASNKPDLFGYEMKNNTTSKTTFGDWAANYYIYKDSTYGLTGRSHFLHIFGKPNPEKNMRYSWSGEPVPKINIFNKFGQSLVVDDENNIHAKYFYSKDERPNKSIIIPVEIQKDNLTIAKWDRESIKGKLERKFNQKGWFKCMQNSSGCYAEIVFGDPINYDSWLKLVQSGEVFFDSGMYEGNARPYSQWRANNTLWERLIVSRH
jgi:hypothetical protein